jgi:uncharacterized membrane protein
MKKKLRVNKKQIIPLESFLLLWGSLFILLSLAISLTAYYTYNMTFRYAAFSLLVLGVVILFASVQQALHKELKSYTVALIITMVMGFLYFILRTQLHHFDFGVGDASDYYIAGVCSVTYSQDIGFFLPLTASISALGYSIFGVAYAPFIDVLLYSATIPLGYFLLRNLGLNVWFSLLMTLFIIINPLSIWFSKTSFSEPIWQLMLLLFATIFYRIIGQEKLKITEFLSYLLVLGVVPFLRGEGALYYGLVIFFALYHFWRYTNLKSALMLMMGLFILAVSIHLTLGIREHYLLGWQFSRVIPGITKEQLMIILYGVAGVMAVVLLLLNSVKKGFSRFPFAVTVTLLAIAFKVFIAYIYMSKKSIPYMDVLVYREYGLALGNFGLPLTLLIVAGLCLLHYKAIKGEKLALLFVVMYAIFYLPFVMQGVTFQDPHEVFLYWSRYYFSIIMVIHLFSLGLVLQFMYEQSQRFVDSERYRVIIISIAMGIVVLFSLNLGVAKITVKEAYLENSYKVFTWLKQRVKNQPVSVLYDDAIRYERHNGLYDAKVFTARMFTVVKINAKAWQKVNPKQLTANIKLKKEMYRGKYLVCISSRKPILQNKALTVIDQTMFPISWREHYRAQPRTKEETLGDVSNSYKNELSLYLTLYKMPIKVR